MAATLGASKAKSSSAWQPMQITTFWVLLHEDGRWWCDKPIFDGDLAQRTADQWNNTPPAEGRERDPVRVVKVHLREQP